VLATPVLMGAEAVPVGMTPDAAGGVAIVDPVP